MSSSIVLPATFLISDSAKQGIEELRPLFEQEMKSDSDVVMVGWGEYTLNDGRQFGDVIVSFYTKDQRKEIEDGIQIVDGVELIFFTIEKYIDRFDGKTLVFENKRFRLV